MGNYTSRVYWGESEIPDHIPPKNVKPTFEPHLGFKNERIPRVSKISVQEMKALQIKPAFRDYCAHYYRDYKMCLRKYVPFIGLCNPELRRHEHCEAEDFILRQKEYERERRLRMRELRKQKENIVS